MTLFYPDVSNNNWGNVNLTNQGQQNLYNFLSQLAGQGFSGVCHKMSEGNHYIDPYGALAQTWCQQNNFPFIGYHWVTTEDPASQVQTWLAAGGAADVMLDFEAGPPSSGDINNFWNVVNAFNDAGVFVQQAYIPRWYWQQIGSPNLSNLGGILLVASDYPSSSVGFAYNLYNAGGGDGGEGWASYGGAAPDFWQFTSSAIVSGFTGVDVNAFRGDVATLAAIFSPGNGTGPAPQPIPAPPTPVPDGGPVTDPNANATAASVADKLDGEINGQQLAYALAGLMYPSTIFGLRNGDGIYPYPEGPNASSSRLDQVTTLAKVLCRTYTAKDGKTYDVFDMLATILEKLA